MRDFKMKQAGKRVVFQPAFFMKIISGVSLHNVATFKVVR